jgi:3',5'-cyclic AMP phosphodiesterase CpdA
VSVIPGNHDAYIPVPWEKGVGLWAPFMTSWRSIDEAPGTASAEVEFPYVRVLGHIAIVGMSSALPMPFFVAAGRIGSAQMQRLRMTLTSLRRQGLFRVVLVHHPPFAMPFLRRRKALLDAEGLVATLGECGAELVLHGHTHVAGLGRIGDVPVIGVPSASARTGNHKDAAAYNIYRIVREGPRWRITTEVRGLSRDGNNFEPKGRYTLDIRSPVHA